MEQSLDPVGTKSCPVDKTKTKDTRRLRRKHMKSFWVRDCGIHGLVFTGRFMSAFYPRVTKKQSLNAISINCVCPFIADLTDLSGSHSLCSY